MMKVYIVMCEKWNGEYDVQEVYSVFANKESANDFVKLAMSGNRSSYSDSYYVEEFEVI